jgi:hypothetical protein
MNSDMRAKIEAAVHRVDVVQLSPDVARLVVFWLGQYAEISQARYGCAPEGLIEAQHAIAEVVTATGGDSRRREETAASSADLLALAQEPVLDVKDAAHMLDLKPDTIRLMCRQGTLGAKKVAGRWFPMAGAVQQELHQRAERSA